MVIFLHKKRSTLICRILCAFVAFTFAFSVILPPTSVSAQFVPQTILNLPLPGTMVPTTDGFIPPLIKGITIHPENPLEFDFIVGTGEAGLKGEAFKEEARKLIKYFLASLTVPEEDMWVNLSPYEQDRIIPEGFGNTEMGRDLLAQDYILKQLTASLMYPEDELGKKFWDRVYNRAYEKFGTTEIPMNTFNKVWIVPAEAVVYEKGTSAFVIKSRLKVMLEEDYEALRHQRSVNREQRTEGNNQSSVSSPLSSEIIKDIIIPAIEKEVNEGETFTQLRQIYNSVILATWYKKTLKGSLLGRVYVDRNKTKGVDIKDKKINQKIYDQYIESFKKGVYNYIKEDYDPATQEMIPRKYFSGGITMSSPVTGFFLGTLLTVFTIFPTSLGAEEMILGDHNNVKVTLADLGPDSEKTQTIEEKIQTGTEEKSKNNKREESSKDLNKNQIYKKGEGLEGLFYPPWRLVAEGEKDEKIGERQPLLATASSPVSREEITEKVIEHAAEEFNVEKESINLDTSFVDFFEADFLDKVQFLVEFEFEYNLDIPDEEAEKIETVRDTVEYIFKNQQSSSPVEVEIQAGYLSHGMRINNKRGPFYVDLQLLNAKVMESKKPGKLLVKKSGSRKFLEKTVFAPRSDNGELEQFSDNILKIQKISASSSGRAQFRSSSPVKKSLEVAIRELERLKMLDGDHTEHRVVITKARPPFEWLRTEYIRDGLSYIGVASKNEHDYNLKKMEYRIYMNDSIPDMSGLRLLEFALEHVPEKTWDIFGQDQKERLVELRDEMVAEKSKEIKILIERAVAKIRRIKTGKDKKIAEALREGIREIKETQEEEKAVGRFKWAFRNALGRDLQDDDHDDVYYVFLEMRGLEPSEYDLGNRIILRAFGIDLSSNAKEIKVPITVEGETLTESGSSVSMTYNNFAAFLKALRAGKVKNGDKLTVYSTITGMALEITFDQEDDGGLFTDEGKLHIEGGFYIWVGDIEHIKWSASSPVTEIKGIVVHDLKKDAGDIFNTLNNSGAFKTYKGRDEVKRQLEKLRRPKKAVYVIEGSKYIEAVGPDRAISISDEHPGAILFKKKILDFRSWRDIPRLAKHLGGGAILEVNPQAYSPGDKKELWEMQGGEWVVLLEKGLDLLKEQKRSFPQSEGALSENNLEKIIEIMENLGKDLKKRKGPVSEKVNDKEKFVNWFSSLPSAETVDKKHIGDVVAVLEVVNESSALGAATSSPVSKEDQEQLEILKQSIRRVEEKIDGLTSRARMVSEGVRENRLEDGEWNDGFNNASQDLIKIEIEIFKKRKELSRLKEEKRKIEQQSGQMNLSYLPLTEEQAAEAVNKLEEIFERPDDDYRDNENKNLLVRGRSITYNQKVTDVLQVIRGLNTDHPAIQEIVTWLLNERQGKLVMEEMKKDDKVKLKFDPFREGDLEKIEAAINEASSPIEESPDSLRLQSGRGSSDASNVRTAGVVKEIKSGEDRVGLTSRGVKAMVDSGYRVLVQKGAGEGSRYSDEEYVKAGGTIVPNAEAVWDQADVIIKVKETLPSERKHLRDGLTVFNYNHFSGDKQLTLALLNSGADIVSFETVIVNGHAVLLTPMSRIAGRRAAWYVGEVKNRLNREELEKIRKKVWAFNEFDEYFVAPENIRLDGSSTLVLGGGSAGREAAEMSARMGAQVVITEINAEHRKRIEHEFKVKGLSDRVRVIDDPRSKLKELLTAEEISEILAGQLNVLDKRGLSLEDKDAIREVIEVFKETDAIVNTVYLPRKKAPIVADKALLSIISPYKNKIIIDVSIDQGGGVEFVDESGEIVKKETTHDDPIAIDMFGNKQIRTPNIPGSTPRVASEMLEEVTVFSEGKDYLQALLEGYDSAVIKYPELKPVITKGRLTDKVVAKELELMEYYTASSPVESEEPWMEMPGEELIGLLEEILAFLGKGTDDPSLQAYVSVRILTIQTLLANKKIPKVFKTKKSLIDWLSTKLVDWGPDEGEIDDLVELVEEARESEYSPPVNEAVKNGYRDARKRILERENEKGTFDKKGMIDNTMKVIRDSQNLEESGVDVEFDYHEGFLWGLLGKELSKFEYFYISEKGEMITRSSSVASLAGEGDAELENIVRETVQSMAKKYAFSIQALDLDFSPEEEIFMQQIQEIKEAYSRGRIEKEKARKKVEAMIKDNPTAQDLLKNVKIIRDAYIKELAKKGKTIKESKPLLLKLTADNSLGETATAILFALSSSPIAMEANRLIAKQPAPGGINLNPELLDLQIKRDGNGVPLPVHMQPIETMHINGFVPIIINVTPVNLPMLLGLVDEGVPADSAQKSKEKAMDLGFVVKYRPNSGGRIRCAKFNSPKIPA